MTMLVHLDGKLVPESDATVNVRDRGFLYGDALFETLRAYGGQIFEWEPHWDRLQRGSERIGLDHGCTRSDIKARIDETLEANELTEAYVRVSITRGQQPGRLTPAIDTDPTVVILVEELPRGGTEGPAVWADPAACTIAETRHVSAAALPSGLKSHNYLNGILAKLEARSAGAHEALLLDADGYLTEGTTTNLFFVEDGAVHTPDLDRHPLLPGVTRQVVLDDARAAGLTVRTGSWTPADLATADEVFVTNTTWEVRPVSRVDERRFDAGPITSKIARSFDERVESECYAE